MLFQLTRYTHSTCHVRQVGWVGDGLANLAPRLYADADLAGDADTQRSTSGVHLAICGPHTNFPLCGVAKRQSCVSSSTPEAEIACGHFALKNVLLLELWEVLLPRGFTSVLHEDNQAMAQVIKTCRNPTVRHLHRAHRISVA